MNKTLLKLKNIDAAYTDRKILKDVNLDIRDNEVLAIIGPNGAGKSTVIKTIFGLTKLVSGEVYLEGKKIFPSTHKMLELGISYIPQGKQIFPDMTVLENLEMGGYILKDKNKLAEKIKEVIAIFPVLQNRLSDRAGSLSGGQQQMLTIARGLICDPKIVLLDEPTIGLSPKLSKEVFSKIKEIKDTRKIAVVVIEHNIESVLGIADRVCILDQGEVFFEGKKDDVKEEVLEEVFLRSV